MYINAIYDADLQNGNGVGVTVCLSGCPIKCPGCFNQEAQNPFFGQEYTNDTEEKILILIKKDYINHLAIIGGESLTRDKIKDLAHLCMKIKQTFPQKKIWLWSGYLWEDIYYLAFQPYRSSLPYQQEWTSQEKEDLKSLLFNIDVLVDGPFVQEKKDLTLKWRGSWNQRVINIPETLKQTRQLLPAPNPILYCD